MTRSKSSKPVQWFATGVFVASAETEEDPLSLVPMDQGAVVHGKAMGTHVSACGLRADSWTKLWDLPFERVPSANRCPACWAHVSAHRKPAPDEVCC